MRKLSLAVRRPQTSSLRLNVDQACGTNLDTVLDVRSRIADETRELVDYLALGSLFADLRDVAAADRAYKQALRSYQDVSPFPVAGICFQLGVLWSELAPEPDLAGAKQWYRQAVAILPMYTRALVHLAEIYLSEDSLSEAETLLRRVVAVGDPEVDWRLADVLAAQGKTEDAEARMKAARSGFEIFLDRHLLAFADHGAEFYSGSGGDHRKALQLARVNADNRPTLRALEQTYNIATSANDTDVALQLLSEAIIRWGRTSAFTRSSLQRPRLKDGEGSAV